MDSLGHDIATLPGRLSGLGLRSAERMAPGAYWAGWANSLTVIKSKFPRVAQNIVSLLASVRAQGSLLEVQEVKATCEAQGAELPSWDEAMNGAEPPPPEHGLDAADLVQGWQCYICSFVEHHFREHVVWPRCNDSRKALLLSQSGGSASAWLRAIPSEPALRMPPLRLQTALRRRLRWPLPLSGGTCCSSCQRPLDPLGDRAAACAHSGRIKLRAGPYEKTWGRVLREAGGRVREHVHLRDTGVPGIDPTDGRHIELVVTGLPIAHGIPAAVDVTLISPLHADGTPWRRAAEKPGSSFARAYRSKRQTYSELVNSNVLRLVVAATEIGGRLNKDAHELLKAAASARAETEPRALRRQAARGWLARWESLLAVSAQCSVAATLVSEGTRILDAMGGQIPLGVSVWLDGPRGTGARHTDLLDDDACEEEEVDECVGDT